MHVKELFDEALLDAHIEGRVVNIQEHGELPLAILNYGQRAQFDNIWDECSEQCRGLIVDDDGNIVARPFRKFFNLNTSWRTPTMLENLPKSQPEITEKMDGSLGILWRFDGRRGIATRGSFRSDQAKWATEWYEANLSDAVWPEGWTPLFEIIYGENRIVVRYEWEGLVLLSLVNNDTGAEMPWHEAHEWARRNAVRHVELYDKKLAECEAHPQQNFEGFVLTWSSPYLKVKVKLAEYCRMHAIITAFSPIRLWECLREGWEIESYKTDMPEDFVKWVELHTELLHDSYRRVAVEIEKAWANRPITDDRKTFALWACGYKGGAFKQFLFAKLDGKDSSDAIWKSIRPHGTHPWKQVDE